MTDDQIAKIKALSRCTFAVGSPDKRFMRSMGGMANMKGASITPRQAAYLNRLCWRYRVQLTGRCTPEEWLRWTTEGHVATKEAKLAHGQQEG